MTEEIKTSSVITIPYRYHNKDGKYVSSKVSISKELFILYAQKLEGKEQATLAIKDIAKTAKLLSVERNEKVKLSAIVRESVLKELIHPALTENYILDTKLITITCRFSINGESHTAPINIPAIMMHALKERFDDPNREISSAYQLCRKTSDNDVNFSDRARIFLLELILDPELQ